MKSKHISYILSLICLTIMYGSCVKDPDLPSDTINATAPSVKTLEVTDKSATSITLTAEVLTENGAEVVERGAFYSKITPIDTMNASKVIADGTGKGTFTIKIENLDDSTKYYIAPYARNKKGYGLGDAFEANTMSGIGIVMTFNPQDTMATTAIVGGIIKLPGTGDILERGVYFSKTANWENVDSVISTMQTDSFVCKLENLDPETTYFVKAYVKNNFGYAIGAVKSFKTTSGRATIGNFTKIDVDFYDATFRAEVISEGDAPVTASGFCWKAGASPTIEDDTIVCASGSGAFEGKIENLLPKTKYYLRAFAINDYGVSYSPDSVFVTKNVEPYVVLTSNDTPENGSVKLYGEVVDEGETAVTEYGICWSTTKSYPDISDSKATLGAGKSSFEGVIENLTGGKTYYVRAYAKNATATSYSETLISFATPAIYVEKKGFGNVRIQGTTTFFKDANSAYLLGGDAGAQFTNELWKYSPESNNWIQMRAYPENNVYGQSASFSYSHVFVFGGATLSGTTINPIGSFYAYSPSSNEWISLSTATSPAPTAFSASCSLDQVFYIGGLRTDSICNDVWKYTPLTNTWTQKTNFPIKQYSGIAVEYSSVMYAGLGIDDMVNKTSTKTLWKYREAFDMWVEETTIPNEATQVIGGVVVNDDLFVVDNTAQIWKYSFVDMSWTKKSKLTVLNNNVHCIYALNNSIYIGLGSGTDKFILYDPVWDN